jgi:hypothetical protein
MMVASLLHCANLRSLPRIDATAQRATGGSQSVSK